MSPWDMRHAVRKVRESGNDRVFLTERGASFGYNNLVVDMRSLAIMREFAPVVFDATHSVQLPSAGELSGGQPQFIPLLSRAAVAAGVDGVFMEVHDNPAVAKSDGANALDLKWLRPVAAGNCKPCKKPSPRNSSFANLRGAHLALCYHRPTCPRSGRNHFEPIAKRWGCGAPFYFQSPVRRCHPRDLGPRIGGPLVWLPPAHVPAKRA